MKEGKKEKVKIERRKELKDERTKKRGKKYRENEEKLEPTFALIFIRLSPYFRSFGLAFVAAFFDFVDGILFLVESRIMRRKALARCQCYKIFLSSSLTSRTNKLN
jgi:hypothetical protein